MNVSVRLVDVSHTVEHGLTTYKGLPAPTICDYLSREASRSHYGPGTEFHIGKVEMVANTGTYVDAPFHRYASGKDLSELPLTSLANLDGIVIRVEAGQRAMDASIFQAKDIAGKAVLVHTGWSVHWNTDQYFEGHPFLTEDAAVYLRDAGGVLVPDGNPVQAVNTTQVEIDYTRGHARVGKPVIVPGRGGVRRAAGQVGIEIRHPAGITAG